MKNYSPRAKTRRHSRHLPAVIALGYLCVALLLFYSAGVAPTSTNLPLSGHVFVVDAGHGGTDGGAVGVNGTVEAPLNLSVAYFLAEELRKQGAEVIMTRLDGAAIAETKREDMQKRQDIMGQSGITAAISIHMNNHTEPTPSGPRVFYQEGSTSSKALADVVQSDLDAAVGEKTRTPTAGDYMVLDTDNTSVLVECGFLSNPDDEQRLNTESYQRLLAATVAQTMAQYFGVRADFPVFLKESARD